MSKLLKSVLRLALFTVLLFIPIHALAATSASQISGALLNDQVLFEVDGQAATPVGDDGYAVLPITYNGTTYLPVRAVGYLLGLGIDYESSTATVLISSTTDQAPPSPVPVRKTGELTAIHGAVLNSKLSFAIDGAKVVPLGQDGTLVLPITYKGTTYLPVRALGDLLGLDVDYESQTKTVILNQIETVVSGEPSNPEQPTNTSMVEVTLMKEIFEGMPADEVIAGAKEEGFDDVTANADGTFTFRMTKEQHTAYVHMLKDDIYKWMDETVRALDSVKEITVNDAFTEMKVIADKELYFNRGDAFNFISISFEVAMLQMFDQVKYEDVQFKLTMIDEQSGEIFDDGELEKQ